MTRTAKLYVIITSIALLGIFEILRTGAQLTPPVPTPAADSSGVATHVPAATTGQSFLQAAGATFYSNATSPLNRLFLQLVIIIAACSIAGRLFRRIGQPAVVGEMVAGILLGPSLF